jgi:hypothetical protein
VLKKILSALGVVAVVLAALIGMSVGKLAGKAAGNAVIQPTQQQVEEKLIEGLRMGAEQSNRLGPRMIDADTRLDTTVVGPGAQGTYFYTFPKYSSRDISADWVAGTLRPTVISSVCASNDMKPSLQYGAIYNFVYRARDGVEVGRFAIGRSDCSSQPQVNQVSANPVTDPNYGLPSPPNKFSFEEAKGEPAPQAPTPPAPQPAAPPSDSQLTQAAINETLTRFPYLDGPGSEKWVDAAVAWRDAYQKQGEPNHLAIKHGAEMVDRYRAASHGACSPVGGRTDQVQCR